MTRKREVQTSFSDSPDADQAFKQAELLQRVWDDQLEVEWRQARMAEDVASLRTAGATWLQIGNALGVTRSAAQQYYGGN
jgi:pyrroloquinoline quinone (PQQ) biosynthesis protein C